jgi:hypothetical protein
MRVNTVTRSGDDFLAHLERAGIHVASPPAVERKCKVYATSVF